MKTKHTPGPWLQDTLETLDGESHLMIRSSSNAVAEIRTHWSGGLEKDPVEVEANAHLISSAPEMYAALKALAGFSLTAHIVYYFHAGGEDLSLREIIDRAIAHAEGREIGMEVEA